MVEQHHLTFAQILARMRRDNLARIRERAFLANGVAKVSRGRSRRSAYKIKDTAISSLLRMGEARLLRLYGRPIGVEFASGGCLHLRPGLGAHGAEVGSEATSGTSLLVTLPTLVLEEVAHA